MPKPVAGRPERRTDAGGRVKSPRPLGVHGAARTVLTLTEPPGPGVPSQSVRYLVVPVVAIATVAAVYKRSRRPDAHSASFVTTQRGADLRPRK